MGAMRKSTKPRRNRTSRASSTPQTIPLGDTSEAANRLALKFDKQASTAAFTAKSLAKFQSEIAGATIRGGSAAPLFENIDYFICPWRAGIETYWTRFP